MPVRFGLSTPGGPFARAERNVLTRLLNTSPSWVLWFEDFASDPPIDAIRWVTDDGALPVITWEPWRWSDGRPVTMNSLASGRHDDHVRRWADALAAAPPLYLRFAHECNGGWYPWGTESADVYVAAWRHLHDVFRDRGAVDVGWMFSPSVNGDVANGIGARYPGQSYVDVFGLDGYNWGCTDTHTRWIAPDLLFADGIRALRAIDATVPLMIAEVGCAESGGDKARWITDFVYYLADDGGIEGFVWFEHDKETDWRIVSSPGAATAMASALHTSTGEGG